MHLNTEFWGWPQYIVLLIFFIGIVINATFNGEAKTDSNGNPFKFNVVTSIIKTVLWLLLLNAGGFFK